MRIDATARSLLPLLKRYLTASRPVDAKFISEYITLFNATALAPASR
jgi:hypothetical protein